MSEPEPKVWDSSIMGEGLTDVGSNRKPWIIQIELDAAINQMKRNRVEIDDLTRQRDALLAAAKAARDALDLMDFFDEPEEKALEKQLDAAISLAQPDQKGGDK